MRQVPQFERMVLFLIIITDELSFWILLPVLAPLIELNTSHGLVHDLHISGQILYGIILGSQPILSVIAAPFWGFISDQLGRRKILLISLIGSLIGYVFYCLSFYFHFLLLLILARIIIGSTTASQAMVQTIIATENQQSTKIVNIATMALVMTLPIAIGPLLSEIFSNSHISQGLSMAVPFVITASVALFNLLLFAVICRSKSVENNLSESITDFGGKLLALIKQNKLHHLLLTFFIMELFWSLFFQTTPLMLIAKYHFGSVQIASFISALGGGMMICLMLMIRKAFAKIAVGKLLFCSLIAGFMAIFCGIIFSNFDIFLLSSIGVAMSVGITYVCLATILSDRVPSNMQGFLMGTTNAVLASAFGITGLLSGLLSSVNVKLPILVCGGLALFNFLSYGKYYFPAYKNSKNIIMTN